MSHISTVKATITDLNALKLAVKQLGGCEFIEGKKDYRWYGRSVGDTPLPEGVTLDMLGKCDHVIRVPGVGYEVGVTRTGKLTEQGTPIWTLAYDFWGPGQGLLEKFGPDCGLLSQAYNTQKMQLEAQALGYLVTETMLPNGTRKLQMMATT